MSVRSRVPASRAWGEAVGYSRAIRVGNVIEVSGTSATRPDGSVVAPRNTYAQAAHILREISTALSELGASLTDVIRTRVFLTDIAEWEGAARAHREAFADTMPVSSFVAVSSLMLPDLVVEIEVTAIVTEEGSDDKARQL